MSFSSDGSYSFDAGNAAYDHLAEGATQNVVVNYTVTDEHGVSAASALTITVTGVNDAPTFGFQQGFEADAAGIITGGGYGGLTVVDESAALQTLDGTKYALVRSGRLGPYTRFDSYRSEFVDGLQSGVKVYLNTAMANGEGFQYSVAANGSDGFHSATRIPCGQDRWRAVRGCQQRKHLRSGPRGAAWLGKEVTESGWYTLQHVSNEEGACSRST